MKSHSSSIKRVLFLYCKHISSYWQTTHSSKKPRKNNILALYCTHDHFSLFFRKKSYFLRPLRTFFCGVWMVHALPRHKRLFLFSSSCFCSPHRRGITSPHRYQTSLACEKRHSRCFFSLSLFCYFYRPFFGTNRLFRPRPRIYRRSRLPSRSEQ